MIPASPKALVPLTRKFGSRRQLLRAVAGAILPPVLPAFQAPAAPPAFEEIAGSASGIRWQHVAGLSAEMYMPETVGPGCAFLDYDNDG